jgi:hypothetical protein
VNIDELVVSLKLDGSNFNKGQKDALEAFKKTDDEFTKRLKNLEDQNKKTGESFGTITAAAEGLFTVFAGAGMAAFARDTTNSVAATGRLAANIGEATSELSTFGRVIARNGGSADAAMGNIKGLSDQMTRLKTLGQGSPDLFSFLGTIGSQEKDGPLETFMRFAEWAEKNKDKPQLVNLVGQQGGLSQDAINEARKGIEQVRRDFASASKGAVTPEQVEKLTEFQKAWVGLDQAIEKTGRDIVTDAAPAFTSIATSVTKWIEGNQKLADSLGSILAGLTALSALKPAAWLLRLLGLGGAAGALGAAGPVGVAAGLAYANLPTEANGGEKNIYENGKLTDYGRMITGQGGGGSGGRSSADVREAFIRSTAASLGIDPDIAVRVAKSEGFNGFTGDNGTSFGDFQLHVTPGGRGGAVGDQFKKWTGLDPSDPANEQRADKFALEWAQNNGWHDFHGAARSGIGDHAGIGGDVHIDAINIHTDSKDPREHGRLVGDAIKHHAIATQANTGLN